MNLTMSFYLDHSCMFCKNDETTPAGMQHFMRSVNKEILFLLCLLFLCGLFKYNQFIIDTLIHITEFDPVFAVCSAANT